MRLFLLTSWLCLYLTWIPHAQAEEATQFHLDATGAIVYCDITPSFNRKKLAQSLKTGTPIQFSWHIHIERIRNYWLNKNIADISFSRQVTPDLLTGQWILDDHITQTQRRTYSLNQAIQWLTTVHQFPIIDKSLLEAPNSYLISVSLDMMSDQNIAWWQDVFHLDHNISNSILNLP